MHRLNVVVSRGVETLSQLPDILTTLVLLPIYFVHSLVSIYCFHTTGCVIVMTYIKDTARDVNSLEMHRRTSIL